MHDNHIMNRFFYRVGNIILEPRPVRIVIKEVLYRKAPKFSDSKIFCNLPKIQIKRPNFRIFRQKNANGIANSEDPDQTAPLGAV